MLMQSRRREVAEAEARPWWKGHRGELARESKAQPRAGRTASHAEG